MKRILNAYGSKFRALLVRVGARKMDKGMQWFYRHADEEKVRGRTVSEALELVYQHARHRVAHCAGIPPRHDQGRPVVFVCDVGLGGLARWLRAAGYMAFWREGAGDAELIEEARQRSAILLTTDSGMMERRVLREGILPAIWLSPGLTKMQQLESVLQELELPRLASRCMDCGGELKHVDKESMADRIPPKTYLWRHEFFLCTHCGKLFWHGTHWRRINDRLSRNAGIDHLRSSVS